MKALLTLLLVTAAVAVGSEPNMQLQWGPEEGNYEVPSATTYCGYKAMRLPTKDELLTACKAGLTKAWDKEGKPYLTSTISAAGRAFAVHSISCELSEVDAQYDSLSIRCVRSAARQSTNVSASTHNVR